MRSLIDIAMGVMRWGTGGHVPTPTFESGGDIILFVPLTFFQNSHKFFFYNIADPRESNWKMVETAG